jgi:DNA-binding PadR family transcriptional regulator
VDVSQSSISNALRRLEKAGVVQHDVRHVQKLRRRVKVYTLTARGYSLAKELRGRR